MMIPYASGPNSMCTTTLLISVEGKLPISDLYASKKEFRVKADNALHVGYQSPLSTPKHYVHFYLQIVEAMEKQFVDLLTEELKLQEAVAEEHSHHMNITFGEAKRVASQYQKEAEKCIAATETCEGARERAEASLIQERKVTKLWEQRARQMGWEGE
ncbi:hypothetical protein V6N11_025730 [Hibiscus sabdariffa]|uniref:Uncharacterized protein n=1 Tax=Hibiscus sabdariffa TaxID=183260 RepID=A0ABR2STV3_9ROSI